MKTLITLLGIEALAIGMSLTVSSSDGTTIMVLTIVMILLAFAMMAAVCRSKK